MFRLKRPKTAKFVEEIALAERSRRRETQYLSVDGVKAERLPFSFAHDLATVSLGRGAIAFENARRSFEHWVQFDLGWVRVAIPTVRIAVGQIVTVEARTLGLLTLNHSHILEVVSTPTKFGFVYGTTKMHVEKGEERFLLEFDRSTEEVTYTLEAVSRPQSLLAWLGYPITRAFQRKFARDSQRRMQDSV
ncbi:MAG TPA: DUF1990 domain-containing protein [Terracidiphilus sp.]|nr:DUF1990 domain-containing protein [Terracidiphilus sp.]